MSELFDDEDKSLDAEDESIEVDVEEVEELEEAVLDHRQRPVSDARRRLEDLLDDKRLRDELEDFLDY